ncbi:CshA/CshB family fibrillar adhesin-related protein [Arcanobacterium hippocoleae]
MIDWVDWSACDGRENCEKLEKTGTREVGKINWDKQDAGTLRSKNLRDGGTYQVKSETQLNSTTTVITSCSILSFRQNAMGIFPIDRNAFLNIHIPGSYEKDGWDDVYQRYERSSETGMPVGIGRANGGRARFDISCHAQLKANGKSRNIPINGLVFADAEVMTSGESAYIVPAKIDAHKSVEWRKLEYHESFGDNARVKLEYGPNTGSDKPQSLFNYNPDHHDYLWQYSQLANRIDRGNAVKFVGQAQSKKDFHPVTTLYASNSDGAYIDMVSGGGNYFAIGVVLGGDSSDGPASYGAAGAIVQPQISGLRITHTIENLKDAPTATVKEGAPPYLGEKGPDIETHFFGNNKWSTLQNDDKFNTTSGQSFDDEDAINKPLLVAAQPGRFTKTIKCVPAKQGTTNVSGWLDWNADGKFSTAERADTTCGSNKQATLSWTVNESMLPQAGKNIAKSLLRLAATTMPTSGFSFDSLLTNGEVEDHAVTLVRPSLTVTKQILGSDGQPKVGADTSGFIFSVAVENATFPKVLTAKNLIEITAAQTTSKTDTNTVKAGKVWWPLSFNGIAPELTAEGQMEPTVTAKVTETPKPGFQFFPNTVCSVPQKDQKFTTIQAYDVDASLDSGSAIYKAQADTYAWPNGVAPSEAPLA